MTLAELSLGRWVIDTEAGEIRRAMDLQRAEVPMPTGYGRVYIGRHHGRAWYAMAHRIIWLNATGEIPTGLQVNHRNGRRWDNRLANLELVTPSGNVRHGFGLPHDALQVDGQVTGPEPSVVETDPLYAGRFLQPIGWSTLV